ncbi:S8 family peptidase [Thermocoleostomius sinensis]|uniref:S8 family serine peptidase n=1 Tax=Thermocoleostomius sinensis A174 TaxID=2016057 RepID=A0A9E8ZCT0_9CYAN|nr:S8 family serine peptidase [Thermocoleostomius sinensis]WAL60486.1 S8 family serine peptidase [Thermocoleostomius sinensis A174]
MSQTLQDTQPYYYADGKKVFLTPSQHYVAIQTSDREEHEGAAIRQLAEQLSPVAMPGEVLELPQYHLTIVKVADNHSRSAAASETVRSFVDSQPDLSIGPSVYEPANSTADEALIPVGEVLVKFKANVSDTEKQQVLAQYNLIVQASDYPEPGVDLVSVDRADATLSIANQLHEQDLVEYAQPNFARLMPRLMPSNGSGAALLEAETQPDGRYSFDQEPSIVRADSPAPAASVNDPAFPSQWALRKIKAPEAWDISMGNPTISIAVLDEGCDLAHEDLSYKLPGYDAVNRTNDPSPLPRDGHGTSCAGIAAARANNGLGGAGVAPNCKILPVRIAYGSGGRWITSDAIIADAIRTAVNRGADVLSNSWGGGAPSSAITSAFQYAQTNGRGGKGCPIAIATGNGDVRGVSYPANLSPSILGVMAVGASNEWDERKSRTSRDGENWWGSNYGPEVDVVAPGVHIYTTDISGSGGYGSGNYIGNFNGTSSATPHVAGLMGLLLSVDPNLRSWEVEEIIKRSADDLGTAGRDEHFGFGRINCRRALDMLAPIAYGISVTPEFIGSGRECFMRVNLRLFNPSINWVRLNSVTLTSHNPDWTAEIDRFEYVYNVANGTMAPFSGQDVQLKKILLKANGNQSGWSYRWSLNWSYTFWRPSAPGLPLSAAALSEAEGVQVSGKSAKGGDSKRVASNGSAQQDAVRLGNGTTSEAGDEITVDRQSKSITIVIR